MLRSALNYHNEGLSIIPVIPRGKKPALTTWEEYYTRPSTEDEVRQWFDNGHNYNIGLISGEVSNNYVVIDIDEDQGIFKAIAHLFPHLFTGRVEQSGSGEGYHIPLRLEILPDFGKDYRRDRPRGNRTWKTTLGKVNIRCRWCATISPPSIHESGNRYIFIQEGSITQIPNLDDLISWLNEVAPPPVKNTDPKIFNRPTCPPDANNLVDAIKAAWNTLDVFRQFGIVNEIQTEPDGQLRLLGNGGLIVAEDGIWYNFSDEIGGSVIEAWGWQRFGSAYDKRRHFRQVLIEMAQAAGIDVAQFYRRGDESHQHRVLHGNRAYWTQQFHWREMRI